MNSFDKVLNIVAKIPKGKVTTYGAISNYLGIFDARIVGFALHSNKDPKKFPCHRVINSKGEISKGYAFGGAKIQQELLENEGIKFNKDGKVDLIKYGIINFNF